MGLGDSVCQARNVKYIIWNKCRHESSLSVFFLRQTDEREAFD